MRTRTGFIGLALVVALCAAPATADTGTKLDSFSGSCAIRGTAFFAPPATNQQQTLDVRYSGPGTCSGTLNGRAVSDARVRVVDRARADGSCVRAKTLAPGPFRLEFSDGTIIRGTYEFDFVGTDGTVTVHGRHSGRASGHGTFANDRTPPDISVHCATDGVRSAPLDIALNTDSPLVSERRASRRLEVQVDPDSAFAGRSTRFAFSVRRVGGGPVGGATVGLAGRRARTGPRGHASIVTALPHRGTWVATASKPGFRRARAEVKAHGPRWMTFDGSCDFTGTVAFDPPLTNTTRPTAQRVRGSGTCSGTLVDGYGVNHELDESPAKYVAGAAAQPQSCTSGTPKGWGELVLRWGRLGFRSEETRAGAAPVLRVYGQSGGSATVNGAATDDPQTLLAACAGDGIAKAHLTGHLATTPTISG